MDDERRTKLPLALTKQILTQQIDLESEIKVLLDDGQRRITIGLGHDVDVPLLPTELEATDVALIEGRELIICTVRAEPGGYVVERGWSNFGLFTMSRRHRLWQSVPFMDETRGLLPGDKVALGSTPAEAIQFRLPDSPLVSRPKARSRRKQALRQQEAERVGTPVPPGRVASESGTPWPPKPRVATPAPAERRSQTPPPPRGRGGSPRHGSRRYQRAFEMALGHWQYDMLTFGGDEGAVIVLDAPELARLKAALGRHPDAPGRGYDLFVRNPDPDLWVAPAGQEPQTLKRGAVLRLKGPGNRIGFGPYVVELPEPSVPSPRFGPNDPPSRSDIAEVFGLSLAELSDPATARTRYRALMRRFHPDRHDGNPGHLSRFHEVRQCWEALDQSSG